MIKQKINLILFFTIILTNGFAQKSVNQLDKNGKRHGIWTKNYEGTDQVRYIGNFRHGKEIDTFKYYKLSKGKSVLSATKVFNDKDKKASVKFFTSRGKLISEGMMDGKNYIGKWIFYHRKSNAIMIEENYNVQGQLSGNRMVYYDNGQIAEKANYKSGKLSGEANWYSESNTLIKTSIYKDGELNGESTYYDIYGNIKSKGTYKSDKKVGIWEYYKGGKLTKKVNHTTKEVIKMKP